MRHKTPYIFHLHHAIMAIFVVKDQHAYVFVRTDARQTSILHEPVTTQCRILTHLRYIAVKNIVRKGEIACNKQFLLSSRCFPPYVELIFHFKYTLKCRLQFLSIWTSLKFCRLVTGQVILYVAKEMK